MADRADSTHAMVRTANQVSQVSFARTSEASTAVYLQGRMAVNLPARSLQFDRVFSFGGTKGADYRCKGSLAFRSFRLGTSRLLRLREWAT